MWESCKLFRLYCALIYNALKNSAIAASFILVGCSTDNALLNMDMISVRWDICSVSRVCDAKNLAKAMTDSSERQTLVSCSVFSWMERAFSRDLANASVSIFFKRAPIVNS